MATKKAPPRGKDLLRRLVLAEAEDQGPLGQALVANSLFNRVALVTGSKGIGSPDRIGGDRYSGKRQPLSKFYTKGKNSRMPDRKSIDSFILASGQYQPISDGRIWTVGTGKNNALTPSQIAEADEAIKLGGNKNILEKKLVKEEGIDSSNVYKLLDATSFRTTGASDDPSQHYNPLQYKNHVFNSAGYPSSLELDIPPGGDIDPVVEQLEKAGGKELGNEGKELGNIESIIKAYEYADKLPKAERRRKIGQTVDVAGSMVGLGPEGPDREHIVQAGDTAAGVARELGVRVEDLGGFKPVTLDDGSEGEDRDLIHSGQVLTAPPEDTTLEEGWEDLKRIWGLYKGGMIGHSDVSDRIQNIMKPRD